MYSAVLPTDATIALRPSVSLSVCAVITVYSILSSVIDLLMSDANVMKFSNNCGLVLFEGPSHT